MTIEIAKHSSPIYKDNIKLTNSNKTEVKKGSFSDILNTKLYKSNTEDLDHIFERAGEKYNIPVDLLRSVAKAESGFNTMSESKAGAQGIMQLMPNTARSLGVTNSFDPEQNIMGGAKYLRQMLDSFDGNVKLSLAAYNAGPGNVLKYEGIPPFKETQNYVNKVMEYCGHKISPSLEVASFKKDYADTEIVNSNTYNGILNLDINSDNQVNELLQAMQGLDLSDILNRYDADSKEYALMMNLYRYKAQLSMLDNDMGYDNI